MKRKVRWRGGACLLAAVVLAGCGEDAPPPTIPQTPPEGAVVTQGIAAESFACGNLAQECSGSTRFVEARCGFVQAPNGERLQVPAVPAEGPDPTDLYNSCRGEGDNPDYLDELQTVVVDEDGEEVTGYLFGDNYFELYVNGKIVARDPIGFVPFNSAVVRFRAKAPLAFAVKLVDWGTHLGVGMEYDRWNVGDGGFVASFSDGTETNAAWKCRAFYMSPLQDVSCVAPGPDTSACPEEPPCVDDDPATCLALHYPRAGRLDGCGLRRRRLAGGVDLFSPRGHRKPRLPRLRGEVRRRAIRLVAQSQPGQPRAVPKPGIHGARRMIAIRLIRPCRCASSA